MSPDWAAKAEPVPYAELDNPQSLNLYAYVQGRPITSIDIDGHSNGLCDTDCQPQSNSYDDQRKDQSAQVDRDFHFNSFTRSLDWSGPSGPSMVEYWAARHKYMHDPNKAILVVTTVTGYNTFVDYNLRMGDGSYQRLTGTFTSIKRTRIFGQ